MQNNKRAAVAILMTATLGLTAVACGDDDGGGDSGVDCKSGTPAPQVKLDTAGLKLEGTKVGLMFDVTGRGDKSFNDSAAAGADLAVAEMGIVLEESTPVAADGSDRTPRLQSVIENGNELIIGVGFLWSAPLGPEAAANPDVKFVEIDGVAVDDNGTPSDAGDDKPLTNTRNVIFSEHEGSFLVGVAAACASKSGKIGFIGGVQVPSIQKFQAGFEAGVKAANPNATVDVKYLTQPPDFTGFNDPAKGKATAAAMYASGIDVVYHAAGGSGKGLFEAAKETGKKPGEVYAIGVDSDQYFQVAADIQPYILTSMVKRVDLAVIDFLKSVADGSFKAELKTYDLRDGISYSGSNTAINDYAGTIDEFKEKIISGEIVVPNTVG
jgi:basic membrane protein A